MTKRSTRIALAGALAATAVLTPKVVNATIMPPESGPLGYKVAYVNYKFYCYDTGLLCMVFGGPAQT